MKKDYTLHVTLERATASERRAARSFAGSSFRRIAPLMIRNRFIYTHFLPLSGLTEYFRPGVDGDQQEVREAIVLYPLYTFIHLYSRICTYVHPLYMYIQSYIHLTHLQTPHIRPIYALYTPDARSRSASIDPGSPGSPDRGGRRKLHSAASFRYANRFMC